MGNVPDKPKKKRLLSGWRKDVLDLCKSGLENISQFCTDNNLKTPKNKPLSMAFLYKKTTVINSVLENQLQVLAADDPIRTELIPISIEVVREGEIGEKDM